MILRRPKEVKKIQKVFVGKLHDHYFRLGDGAKKNCAFFSGGGRWNFLEIVHSDVRNNIKNSTFITNVTTTNPKFMKMKLNR